MTRLIGDGAEREDDPSFRSLRHFHNPLAAPWDGAGLFGRFQSSTLWQQNAGQHGIAGGGNWSWQDARDWYLKALTGSAPADRASAFGATFEALGHLTHLVQDASVPAHVRNDPHPILDGYERHVDRLQRAAPGSARRQRFESLLNAGPPFSPAPAFTPTGHPQASVPVARLIDSDTFLGGNFGVLTLPSLGIAEYTNGNFLSDDTLFTDFVFPRRSALGADFFEPEGAVVRRYFEKAFEGETVRHFVAESALYDPVTAILGQPAADALTLTRLVYEDYAAKLLPLAVRYSASLLDYFFRGRLDVDLVDDGSGLRLVGANASAEALDSGTLTVYADGTDGVRERASSGVGVGRVEPGGTLPAVTVAPPEGAERFVAVYTGALGEERPGGAFPGGVIGKVLGGVRVEEVFNDGTQWKLRTPKGVFGLATGLGPLTVAQYEVVKWGDTDSALVARTPLSASPPTVAVFDVLRQPGSSELAILSGGTDVVVTERKRVAFPSPVQLTTVNFTQTVVYRQHLARAEQATTYVWVPLPPPTYNPDVDGSYGPGSASFSPFTFEVAYEQTIPFNQSFPVRLDLPHNWDIGTVFAPYYWQLRDISVDAAGRPLGLVRVFLSQPQVAPVTVPVFKVNASGATEQYTTKTIAPYLPEQVTPLLWALVDLEQGRVVASTAEPTVTINSQVVDDQIDRSCCLGSRTFYVHSTLTYSGGPQNGTTVDSGWRAAGQILPTSVGGTIGTVTDVALPANGEQSLSLDGWLREDLRQAMLARGRYTIQPATVPDDFLFVYTCDPSNVCSAMRIQQPLGKLLQGPGRLLQAVRPRPVAGNQRIVFLALSFVSTRPRGNLGDLLVWDPDLSRAQFIGAGLGVGFHTLGSATGSAALVSSSFFAPSGRGTTLFRLDPTQASAFFANIDLTQAYTLLEPRHLYNTTDLKFHLLQPSLERTALPATLATLTNVAGHRARDYHSIRLLTP
ncbi:MAG: hypothetical protein HYU25_09260 [Candidatus Rokubacteria bacterium]|nr:hypothetical protein [Candidatus Rokubacteria bacterium]